MKLALRPARGAWRAGRTLALMGRGARWPEVALDAAGNLYASWWRDGFVYAAAARVGERWSAPQRLSQTPDFTEVAPQIAAGPRGDVVVWWSHGGGSFQSVLEAAVRPAGADAWSATELVSPPGVPGVGAQMAVDADGNVLAVFARGSARRDPSGSWQQLQTPTPLGSDELALDGAGGAVTVWNDIDGLETSVKASSLATGSGSWGPVISLYRGRPNASRVALGLNAAGLVVAVWQRKPGAAIVTFAAARRAGATRWGPARRVATGRGAGAPLPIAGQLPSVDVDASGRAYALWEECRRPVVVRCSIWSARGTP